jgi:hypothetical protein
MTNAEIELLKKNIDKDVEIRTVRGEVMVAKVGFVTHWEEYDEHSIIYKVVSSNMMKWYERHGKDDHYELDFDEILSVRLVDH